MQAHPDLYPYAVITADTTRAYISISPTSITEPIYPYQDQVV